LRPRLVPRLFAEFIRGWQERARSVGAELLAVTPDRLAGILRRLLPRARVVLQQGEFFGERLEAAFQAAFAGEAASVVAVPGDAPPPNAEAIVNLFRHLEKYDDAMAIAPSEDGGVNLLGFARSAQRDLGSVAWFGPSVCSDLLSHSERFNLPLLVAAALFDIDQVEDVWKLYRRSLLDATWLSIRHLLAAVLCTPLVAARRVLLMPNEVFGTAVHVRGPPAYAT